MPTDEQRAIVQDCQALMVRVFTYLDHFDYDQLLPLFADDAIWVHQGKPAQGHAQIMASLEARSRTQICRHLLTNLWVDVCSPDTAEGGCYFIGARHDTGVALPDGEAAPTDGLAAVGEQRFKFRRNDDGWQIADLRRLPMTFMRASR